MMKEKSPDNKFSKIFLYELLFFTLMGCQRSIYWDLGAKGTLKDETGICLPSSVSGTFYNGIIPGEDTAFVEVKVNVFSPGSYIISTDEQNGLRFFDSGYFNSPGMYTVKLEPRGRADAPVQTNFTIHFDTSACSFTLGVKDSALLNTNINKWRYTDTKNGMTYQGTINATYLLRTPLNTLLSLRQETADPHDTTFQIGIAFDGPVRTGAYKTDSLNNFALSTDGRCINCAWGVIYKIHGAVTTIVIESYDPDTKIIKGTFSGTTVNWNDSIAVIKDGRFSAIVK